MVVVSACSFVVVLLRDRSDIPDDSLLGVCFRSLISSIFVLYVFLLRHLSIVTVAKCADAVACGFSLRRWTCV